MSHTDSNARRLIKHSTIYAIGNISRQLIGFVMLPVYTRYLTPTDYGVIGLLTFSVSLVEGVLGARLGQAMPKFYFERDSQRDRDTVISTALLVTGGISALMSVILFLARGYSGQLLFGSHNYGAVVGLFCFSILSNALESQSLVYLQIRGLPRLFVAINLAKLATQFSFNIFFVVYLRWGIMGIAVSSVSSSAIFALLLSIFSFSRTGIRCNFMLAGRMIAFSWPLWTAGIASLYISSAGTYYIRIFSSLADVGLYELAVKFGAVMTFLVAQPFTRFWDIERFNHYRKGNGAEILRSVFYTYTAVLVLAGLGISLFCEPVVRIMAGPEFHDAYRAVPLITLSALIHCLTDYCNFSFLATGKTSWISRNFFATAVGITVLYLIFIPIMGFVGAALAMLLAEIAQFLFMQRKARKFFDMQLRLPLVFAALGIGAAAYVVGGILLAQSNLILDIGVKSLIYIVFSGLLIAYVARNLGASSLLRNLDMPFFSRLPFLKLLFH